MSTELIAWLGLVISLVLGIGSFLVAKKVRSKKQNQKIAKSGTGYQAGRDINLDQNE